MSNPISIYSFPLSGHAHRVVLFAALANITHELVNVDLAAGEHKQAEFLAINPDGQVPVIKDGDTVISDSNAILVYLARQYAPEFLPQHPAEEAQVQKFLTMAAGEIAYGPAAARLITLFSAPLDAASCLANAHKALTKLETHLNDKQWLVANKLTIADIAIYSYVAHAPEGNVSLHEYPNVRSWLANMQQQPGFLPMPASAVGLVA